LAILLILTLGVHEVGDGDGVATLDIDGVGSEGVIGGILGARGTEVLLAEALEVVLNGVGSLGIVLEGFNGTRNYHGNQTYKLVSKRNLVELHLVNTGLSRAQKRGSSKKSALHDGQSGR
jgi:hypothetical protein